MIRRYTAGAAAGAALAVSLTGCLGDGGTSKAGDGTSAGSGKGLTAVDALGKASEKSGTIKSFHATMIAKTSVSGQDTSMSGSIDYRLKPELGMKMNFTNMTVAGKSTQGFQEILLGDAIYVKVPALTKQTGGKPWLKFSLSGLSAKSGIDVKGLLSQAQQADPSVSVKMLTASNDVNKVGSAQVGGVSTTHYHGTYSVQQALAKLDSTQRDQVQKSLAQSGLDKMAFDVWVDGDQMPRKIKLTTPAGSTLKMDTTMTYSHFNEQVSITAPPAGEVTDGSNLGSNPNAPA
jgi:hypothetical protein